MSNINGVNKFWLARSGNGETQLRSSAPLDDAILVTLYDATGRMMLNDSWATGTDTRVIGASFLPPGIYLIRLDNGSTATTLKWIK